MIPGRSLPQKLATDEHRLSWEILSHVTASTINPGVNLLIPPPASMRPYNTGGFALHRLRAFLKYATAGQQFRFRLFGWAKPTDPNGYFNTSRVSTPQELGYSVGRMLCDLLLTCSSGPYQGVLPIGEALDASALWWEASVEAAVNWKYHADGIRPMPDPLSLWAARAAANEVQTITMAGTGGTWAVSFNGSEATSALAFDITKADLQTALRALTTINGANVTVTGSDGGPYILTFSGTLAGLDVPMISIDNTLLTGGLATVVETTKGEPGGNIEYRIDTTGDQLILAQPISMGSATEALLAMKPFN